ncbi:MAG: helix-turn-helix domain-containing protein [Candidatus Howiella sp.]
MYHDIYVKTGLNVSYYRKLRYMIQDMLAEKVGVDKTHISKFERATAGVSLDTILDIAEALDVPVDKFFVFRD